LIKLKCFAVKVCELVIGETIIFEVKAVVTKKVLLKLIKDKEQKN
jgi:hypothetical protein